MQKLAEICVRRPVFASVLILILVVFGLFSYQRLGVDRFPDIDFPVITVTTIMPGANPEEIELEVTDKIEEAVNTVSGIEDLASVSAEGISQVFVNFYLEKDIDVAAQEVRDRINRILRDLPNEIDPPTIEKLDPDAAPIVGIAVAGPHPLKEITEYADKVLRRRLESVTGVGQVMLVGGQPRQINVTVDPVQLKSHNLTIASVAHALRT
jgi:hydrophobic/amphiphilic exporter-1 (mainly G- bacteria), HAE1 family